MGFTFGIKTLTPSELSTVDPRILLFVKGWKLVESYKGKDVVIPDYTPVNYFEALNKPEGVDEDEKQLTLWCGWAGRSNGKDIDGQYDAEMLVTLSVNGKACHDPSIKQVNVEVIKMGGAHMVVTFNCHFITDFNEKFLWNTITNGYQTVSNIYQYL